MRIVLRVGKGMVQAVHDAICPRAQVRRTLSNIGKYEKEPLPGFAHRKGAVGCVAVLKKRLAKQGQIPV